VTGNQQSATVYNYYIKNLKVSDQPADAIRLRCVPYADRGVWLQFQGRTNYNDYAAFDPFGRTDPTDRGQSWKVPGSSLFDVHGTYRISNLLPVLQGGDVRLFGSVLNLFNTLYVQDATDNSSFNGFYQCTPNYRPCAADPGHDAQAAEVYLGLPRTFNAGFEVIF
jgi:iron complex outermembrane recepter protein